MQQDMSRTQTSWPSGGPSRNHGRHRFDSRYFAVWLSTAVAAGGDEDSEAAAARCSRVSDVETSKKEPKIQKDDSSSFFSVCIVYFLQQQFLSHIVRLHIFDGHSAFLCG